MELWDVLDENGRKTGKVVERGKLMKKGEYHLVVFVWIKNTDGRFLISKRSENKPGATLWETPGGSAIAGETSKQAALREVKEELGISLRAEKGIFLKRLRFETNNSWFADIWVFNDEINISDIVLQVEEVSDVKWATKDELLHLIQDGQFFNGSIYLDNLLFADIIKV